MYNIYYTLYSYYTLYFTYSTQRANKSKEKLMWFSLKKLQTKKSISKEKQREKGIFLCSLLGILAAHPPIQCV